MVCEQADNKADVVPCDRLHDGQLKTGFPTRSASGMTLLVSSGRLALIRISLWWRVRVRFVNRKSGPKIQSHNLPDSHDMMKERFEQDAGQVRGAGFAGKSPESVTSSRLII
jgi:hypothetical protein